MPNVNDLKRSRFLSQKDIVRPVLVTITAYKEMNIAMEGAEEQLEWVLFFKEFDKPFVLKPVNGQLIAAIIGSIEFPDWIGHQIVLYIEPSVTYGTKVTGGIRCRAPKGQTVAQPKPQTFDRAKSIENLRAAQKAALLDTSVDHSESDKLAAEIAADNEVAEATYEQQETNENEGP